MAGPLKPNDPNRRGDSNGGDDKKRTPLGFFSIVLWAIMLVFLLNTCRSTVEIGRASCRERVWLKV